MMTTTRRRRSDRHQHHGRAKGAIEAVRTDRGRIDIDTCHRRLGCSEMASAAVVVVGGSAMAVVVAVAVAVVGVELAMVSFAAAV